jgi:hypothetical protein
MQTPERFSAAAARVMPSFLLQALGNKGDAVLRRSRKGKKVRRSDSSLERTHGDVLPHLQTSTTFLTQSVG